MDTLKQVLEKINRLDSKTILAFIKGFDRRTWVFISCGAFAFLFYIFFMFSPAWVKRPALNKKSVEVSNQLIRLRALVQKKPEYVRQKDEISVLISDFHLKLFKKDEVAFLLGNISKLAEQSQIELLASRPLDKEESFPEPFSQKYKKHVYQLTIEGGYHAIAGFVSNLESYDRLFQIQSLTIMPQAKTPDKHVADLLLMAVSHNGGESYADAKK